MSKHLAKLRRWLAKPGNSAVFLALKMGYKTPHTIQQWVIREKIPTYRVNQLMEIIDGNAGKRNKR